MDTILGERRPDLTFSASPEGLSLLRACGAMAEEALGHWLRSMATWKYQFDGYDRTDLEAGRREDLDSRSLPAALDNPSRSARGRRPLRSPTLTVRDVGGRRAASLQVERHTRRDGRPVPLQVSS